MVVVHCAAHHHQQGVGARQHQPATKRLQRLRQGWMTSDKKSWLDPTPPPPPFHLMEALPLPVRLLHIIFFFVFRHTHTNNSSTSSQRSAFPPSAVHACAHLSYTTVNIQYTL
ncbi:hypothetical protein E2C01_011280 [Portunus trituberculatus]|uniref:Uncharacterized protein n=1 Tax=Portunus trituberculatus TaxID=210409 RepID=A0A5B7DAP7_PORTR|nr:hypothetical protein [Portunus trituberculatus]